MLSWPIYDGYLWWVVVGPRGSCWLVGGPLWRCLASWLAAWSLMLRLQAKETCIFSKHLCLIKTAQSTALSQTPPYSLHSALLFTRALGTLVVHYIGNTVPFGTRPIYLHCHAAWSVCWFAPTGNAERGEKGSICLQYALIFITKLHCFCSSNLQPNPATLFNLIEHSGYGNSLSADAIVNQLCSTALWLQYDDGEWQFNGNLS